MIEQIIPFSSETMEVERTALSLPTKIPVRRLDIRFGKMSLADFFDLNVGGTDSHYQFLNWVVDNNGAWDYAADTRGYTFAALFDYEDRHWGLRFAEGLMPKVANGPNLDADVARARAENVELELRPKLLKPRIRPCASSPMSTTETWATMSSQCSSFSKARLQLRISPLLVYKGPLNTASASTLSRK
jgi:hypothetical protein